MSVTKHYRANLRDIYFNLFEFYRIQDSTLGKGPYTDLDEDTIREILGTFATFCEEEMALSFASSDRTGLIRDEDGTVTLPDCLKKSLDSYYEGGWHKVEHSVEMGGYGIPRSVFWTSFELLAGANAAMTFYLLGSFAAKIVEDYGTDEQKKAFLDGLVNRRWGSTMVLTEPDAGSDVGAGRTKAKHIEGDIWSIEGVKRFITNGDFDATENIMHMVLARPEGAASGTKGLSLFLVPKFWVNEDGSLGERNDAYCSNLETKMGLKASATCEMTFGDRGLCRGYLLGGVHDGIRQMFNVIEYARMGVGMKSMSTLSTAYLNSLEYVKERVQGPDLVHSMDKDAPRVTIIHHPDVRRLLMKQKSYAEGLRGLGMLASTLQDEIVIAGAEGDKEKVSKLHLRNDLLLPLVKGFGSERVYEILADSLQCLGGSGYCKDYPHEQYIRDQKIDTLYEGTTAIQGLDLIFRKIMKDGGNTLRHFLGRIHKDIEAEIGGASFETERNILSKAFADFSKILEMMVPRVGESLYHAGLHSTRILFSLSELLLGWLLLKQAGVALKALETAEGADKSFYEGKCASARYFCREELPRVSMSKKVIEHSDLSLMELSEEAF